MHEAMMDATHQWGWWVQERTNDQGSPARSNQRYSFRHCREPRPWEVLQRSHLREPLINSMHAQYYYMCTIKTTDDDDLKYLTCICSPWLDWEKCRRTTQFQFKNFESKSNAMTFLAAFCVFACLLVQSFIGRRLDQQARKHTENSKECHCIWFAFKVQKSRGNQFALVGSGLVRWLNNMGWFAELQSVTAK
jgi:hypothetical protein